MAYLELEADIENALTGYIRDELNSNSFGVKFSLGFWYNDNPRGKMGEDTFKVVDGSPFEYEETDVVPMTIEQFDGNITALEGVFNAEYSIPLTFQVDIENEDHFQNVVSAINEIKNRNRAQLRRLPVTTNKTDGTTVDENFNMVIATNNLTPVGDFEPIKGKRWIFSQLTFFFDISKDILYGNHAVYKLAGYDPVTETETTDRIRLYPINPAFDRTNSRESFQNFTKTQTESVISQSEYSIGITIFMEDKDIFRQLLQYIINIQKMRTEFKLVIEFHGSSYDGQNPDDFTPIATFEEPVLISNARVNTTIGEPMFLTMELSKALVKKN